MKKDIRVAVLGASAKEDRYSYQCVDLLLKEGYDVVPITPAKVDICDITPTPDVASVKDEIDVLTFYVNQTRSTAMEDAILKLNPKRIIFNPGAENSDLEKKCKAQGIKTENACTLILLRTGQF